MTVEINNEEVPIMDGSAKDFMEELKKIEIKILNSKRKYLKVLKKLNLLMEKEKFSLNLMITLKLIFN